MLIKQLSIFVENKSGRLADITSAIADFGINIRALSIADTTDFGILRIIVDDPEDACAKLRSKGLTVSVCDVLSAHVSNKPDGLASVLRKLSDAGICVEYVYAFAASADADGAMVVIRADDSTKAEKILSE